MRLLLDTHALIWWWTDDARLPARVRAAIFDEANDVFVSAASAWEIGIKHRLGKLSGVPDVVPRFDELVSADGFAQLPITQRHALQAGTWPQAHRDPFDRMLAAQAALEDFTLVTCDAALGEFPCRRFW